jgi:hypothetical protein
MGDQYDGIAAGYGLKNSPSEGSYTAKDKTDKTFDLLNYAIFKSLVFMYRRHAPLLIELSGDFVTILNLPYICQ